MSRETKQLLERFRNQEVRALSRLISLAENLDDAVADPLAELYPAIGRAKILGITGPPGAGKSTLTSCLVRLLREQKKTVAVVAVDPVSPFTGGALLGDRIRLVDHFNDEGVFIRSLSTRGKLGGLSLATRQVVHLADAFGFDYILVETVGVGQSEVDVRKVADVTAVVLVPEWGDAVQTLKAGLLEIGDMFVVNKSDREGADRFRLELQNMLQMAKRPETPLLSTNALEPKTVVDFFQAFETFVEKHQKLIATRRSESASETARELLDSLLLSEVRNWLATQKREPVKNPYRFFSEFKKQNPPGSFFAK